jgi:CubicO group peptidase (beta-lactamase class C family)
MARCAALSALACLVLAQACSTTGTVDHGDHPAPRVGEESRAVIADLERSIPELMRKARIPGLSIALIREGEIVWDAGFGVKSAATGEPVTADTIFEAASLTKPLFAYAVMRLVEQGVLDLDTPLVTYLHDDVIEKKLLEHSLDEPGFHREWLEQVTARHVLSHTSGLPHGERRQPFPLFFEPGAEFKYSARGYYFLQLAVEHLTDKPLQEIAREQVLEPLGMSRSSLIWIDEYETTSARGHDRLGEPRDFRKYDEAHAAASMYTTAGDYARFVAAVLNDEGLAPETVVEMLTPEIDVEGADYWSLGFGLQRDENGQAFWQWGDWGIFRNFVIGYKELGLAVVYLTNSSYGLSICDELVGLAIGGNVHSLDWLKYPAYDSPDLEFFWSVLDDGAAAAIRRLPELRSEDPGALNEDYLNRLGYELLGVDRHDDAVAVLELNVEEHPFSANTYDSLGEAYATRDGEGDLERAIASYKKALTTVASDPTDDPIYLEQVAKNAEAMLADLEKKLAERQDG